MFDIPRDTILDVDHVDVRLDASPHPFEAGNAAAIEDNWRREQEANPALFNGEVVLLSELAFRAGGLVGRTHAIRFATFLYWRLSRPVASAEHVFAHAMLVSNDNALVAIRMAPHTSNPGRVYFAAGSFEPQDFPGGRVDLHLNMAREVREETGLDIEGLRREGRCRAWSGSTGTVIFKRYFLERSASEIAADIRTFVATDPDPEIDGPVVIRSAGDLPANLMAHMRPMIEWHFANPADRI
jgi:8-oxo-dGTP pyrophosphatase MutT (NUDIX family)